MGQLRINAILISAATLFLMGCGGGNMSTIPPPVQVVSVTVTPANTSLQAGQAQQFSATVTGTSNTAVLWSVNGTQGGSGATGTIDNSGRYTAPSTLQTPNTVQVSATSVADTNKSATASVQIQPAPAAVTAAAAARFLEQASFGPTPEVIAHVQQVGLTGFLNEQFAIPATAYTADAKGDLTVTQQQFFAHAVTAPDQLRQRVAFALSQIFVISGRKIDDSHAFVPYENMLLNDAFGNYFNLLRDVTLSPAMGNYLDMVNNDKADPVAGTNPNENYAREILQLFSIGVVKLNTDGTITPDQTGKPIPTYTQDTIEGFAHAFTGWTYPTAPGQTLQIHNPESYAGPMEVYESNHDTPAKLLLNGLVLPAGQSAGKDLDDALNNIFRHPNVGPFICVRLIRALVTSNPDLAYVQRAVTTFNDNGSGVRGDLKAVVTAILLDPEARRGDDPTQFRAKDGHLKEPALYIAGVLRALNAKSDGDGLDYYSAGMRQDIFYSPTVFNYYPPDYTIAGTNLIGPEFKLRTSPTAIAAANFVSDAVYGSVGPKTMVDLTSWDALASDPAKLVDGLSAVMMHGAMSDQMRQSILTAIGGMSDAHARASAAVYLIASSPQYQVQH